MAFNYIPAQPLINGTTYDWCTINFNMLGKTSIFGVTSIEYKKAQEVEMNYGAGAYPVSRSFGNISNEGKVTLYLEEVDQIRKLVPNHQLFDIPAFDIIINYLPANGQVITDVLKSVIFKNDGVSVSQNDKGIKVEIELSIGDIQFGVSPA